jgi:hypothetical protein
MSDLIGVVAETTIPVDTLLPLAALDWSRQAALPLT